MEKSKLGMHEGHCCVLHGCKYGDEDCPVISGETQQRCQCESCDYDGIKSLDELKEKVRHIESGCDCCEGDEALYWKDNEHNAFVAVSYTHLDVYKRQVHMTTCWTA